MMTRVRFFTLGLLVLLVAGGLTLSAPAWGSEPEAPFWDVFGKRLETGSKTASITSNGEMVLQSKIGETEVEIQCANGAFAEGDIEGSLSKHAGKATGVLELKECKLLAKESGVFKEQTECEITTIKSGKLVGKLWFEGTKTSGGTVPVIVFEPKEGKKLAEIVVKSKKEKGCGYTSGSPYALEGSFAIKLLPNSEEFSYIQWVLPTTSIAAWDPEAEAGEKKPELTLATKTASLRGEVKAELETQERFGGGVAPVTGIEAPFWAVGGKRLEAGKEKELESKPITGEAKLLIIVKGKETETKCKSAVLKKVKMIGSINRHDGKFTVETMELAECAFYLKESENLSYRQNAKYHLSLLKNLPAAFGWKDPKQNGKKPLYWCLNQKKREDPSRKRRCATKDQKFAD